MNKIFYDRIKKDLKIDENAWKSIKLDNCHYITNGNIILLDDNKDFDYLKDVSWCYPLLWDMDNSLDFMSYTFRKNAKFIFKRNFKNLSKNYIAIEINSEIINIFKTDFFIENLENIDNILLLDSYIYCFNGVNLIAIIPCLSKPNFIDM